MTATTAPAPRAATPREATARATALRIIGATFLVFVVTGGGRIVGSDEVTMLELSRAMLHGGIAVPEGATLTGPDGRSYTKNAAAQAVLALPLVAAAEAAAGLAGLDPQRRELAVRFGASFLNALVTALVLGLFYAIARKLHVRPRPAFAATMLLGFSTPLWAYSKSYMAEPLQALGLLMALAGAAGVGDDARGPAIGKDAHAPGRFSSRLAFLGVLLAVSAKLSMLPIALACLVPLWGRPLRAWRAPLLGLVVALAGHAIYDFARFGTPFETGYGTQATPAAYSTPLWVGVYGLVISSGKGVLWFAPVLWLALSPAFERGAGRAAGAGAEAAQRVRRGVLWAWLAALLLYGRFQHWAGDGSFGPRYLIPVIPLGFLLVLPRLDRATRATRRWATLLGVVGCLVQVGGVAIYFGAQMREAGDYPYTLPLDHPRFMSDSHFNPRYTPILGHWRMLLRNAGEHLRGHGPTLELSGEASAAAPGGAPGATTPGSTTAAAPGGAPSAETRLGIAASDQERLLHALDFWWLYLGYAGLPRAPVWSAVVALKVVALVGLWQAWRASAREARA